jgi:hypothetical protein
VKVHKREKIKFGDRFTVSGWPLCAYLTGVPTSCNWKYVKCKRCLKKKKRK